MADELPPARVVRGVRPLALHSPPRRIPPRLWFQLYFNRWPMQFGMFWIGAVAWFAVAVLPDGRWNRHFDAHTTGRIERVEVDKGGDEPDARVFFSFRDTAGVTHENFAIVTGDAPEIGAPCDVAYVAGDPRYAELVTPHARSRYTSLGFDVVILGAFAFVGLLICLADTLATRRDVRLLRRGRETTAVLVDKRSEEIGDGVVWLLTFEFEADGKTERFQFQPGGSSARLEDDRDEPIVYDPAKPSYFTPLDHLPGHPVIENGQLRARKRVISHLFVIPLGGLAAIATLLSLWYR